VRSKLALLLSVTHTFDTEACINLITLPVRTKLYSECMSDKSKIEWTGASWNPVRGCSKVSPGCKHCYAETFAERFRGVLGHPYEQGFDLRLVPEKLEEPLRWKKPRRIFVNSMSDLFHEGVPDAYILKVAEVMARANWQTYQVLSKRSGRMADMLNSVLRSYAELKHIWWGVSVEDKKYGLPRIEHLRAANVAVRFLSIEPLLEDIGNLNLDGIHWVIVGGESGHVARPFDLQWARSILSQCRQQGVACFVKQVGRRPIDGGIPIVLSDFKGGDPAEWPEDLRVREFPERLELANPPEKPKVQAGRKGDRWLKLKNSNR
jgi:protein gp37